MLPMLLYGFTASIQIGGEKLDVDLHHPDWDGINAVSWDACQKLTRNRHLARVVQIRIDTAHNMADLLDGMTRTRLPDFQSDVTYVFHLANLGPEVRPVREKIHNAQEELHSVAEGYRLETVEFASQQLLLVGEHDRRLRGDALWEARKSCAQNLTASVRYVTDTYDAVGKQDQNISDALIELYLVYPVLTVARPSRDP